MGCDKKILWPSVGLSLGLIGTCWYFFGLIGSRWYVVAFGVNGHQTDHRGLRSFAPGVGIPAVNIADNRSASKSLYCHLTALEPCTEAFSKSSVVGRLRAGMALIAALSGSGTLSPPWRLVPRK